MFALAAQGKAEELKALLEEARVHAVEEASAASAAAASAAEAAEGGGGGGSGAGSAASAGKKAVTALANQVLRVG
jgi:hypothetical protein